MKKRQIIVAALLSFILYNCYIANFLPFLILLIDKCCLANFQVADFKNHILQFSGFVWHGDEVSNSLTLLRTW